MANEGGLKLLFQLALPHNLRAWLPPANSAKDIASNQRVAASYLGFQHEGASGI